MALLTKNSNNNSSNDNGIVFFGYYNIWQTLELVKGEAILTAFTYEFHKILVLTDDFMPLYVDTPFYICMCVYNISAHF